jgi:hypothetical protein
LSAAPKSPSNKLTLLLIIPLLMYATLLLLHSWTRWLVLIFGAWALFRALTADRSRWTKPDNIAGASFIGSMHLQLLLGLILYFGESPSGIKAFAAAKALGTSVMKDAGARFFAVEHITLMIIAVVCAQVGRSISKKTALSDPAAAHRKALLWFGVALALVLLMIPWGLWNPARPLFR